MAPRSWPSRPGLAMRTLIFRLFLGSVSMVVELRNERFASTPYGNLI
jgi:hypothetical protein